MIARLRQLRILLANEKWSQWSLHVGKTERGGEFARVNFPRTGSEQCQKPCLGPRMTSPLEARRNRVKLNL